MTKYGSGSKYETAGTQPGYVSGVSSKSMRYWGVKMAAACSYI